VGVAYLRMSSVHKVQFESPEGALSPSRPSYIEISKMIHSCRAVCNTVAAGAERVTARACCTSVAPHCISTFTAVVLLPLLHHETSTLTRNLSLPDTQARLLHHTHLTPNQTKAIPTPPTCQPSSTKSTAALPYLSRT
jgi:hypothetical protein